MGGSATSAANANLGTPFKNAWAQAATDPVFQTAQINYRNQVYWTPAFNAAVADGLSNLGLAIYYDTSINHGPGDASSNDGSFDDIRSRTTILRWRWWHVHGRADRQQRRQLQSPRRTRRWSPSSPRALPAR
jgi:hypothetical protein